jgi:hypothetical protein
MQTLTFGPGTAAINRIVLVLIGMQNGTFGPYLAAKHRIIGSSYLWHLCLANHTVRC